MTMNAKFMGMKCHFCVVDSGSSSRIWKSVD